MDNKVIFSTKGGWIHLDFLIKDRFKIRLSASYLDDIPIVWLNSILANFKNELPLLLKGDSEYYKFSILESDEGLSLIVEDYSGDADYFGTFFVSISKDELIKTIIYGVKDNFSEMLDWNPKDLSESERTERSTLLLDKLNSCMNCLRGKF